ncbi:IQ domain-containing calmodulin-binding protein [Cryptococcus neoformans var. grubii Br795]|nr:IQ domain-containing calmodulin-binding protein [Cryptococcus neoformans var. grubii AD1-83a]OWZ50953.1 IQ domain-containing calmodulin-binding protein [Cryptococcus neoformans var. grubii 125.91]OXG46072.1 IQ domain-containing calmodulin-binding protein [Cryptococcus neoformans var. grubii Th84]OXG50505.1 IQ domain-containing calmodulin-binding protein [Cryptococcus neoformans var. grubii MW-RSA1955]OXG53939.1 IQ domain-containing calmodulin-binding protein [Cryptococcus neoformans var. gru
MDPNNVVKTKIDTTSTSFGARQNTLASPVDASIQGRYTKRGYETTANKNMQAGTEEEKEKARRAAVIIQKHYRGHAARKHVQGLRLQREARWNDLVKHSQEVTYAKDQLDNKNDVVSRWHRAAQAASRLQNGDGLYSSPVSTLPSGQVEECDPKKLTDKELRARKATFWGSLSLGVGKERDEKKELPFHSKELETQHWLEMIDGKHRYGSNMKHYFRKWKEADTSDNFFRWLDKGEGKDLDLEEMPRERLENERITYLSAEERLNYVVKVDKDGRLRWAHNNEFVDTAAGRWKDAGDGTGIVPVDPQSEEDENTPKPQPTIDPYAPPHNHRVYQISRASSLSNLSSDSYSPQSSELDENESTHYVGLDQKPEGWLERQRKRLTPGGVRRELLRKTVRRNTWIYVSDMKLNLFVGIKQSGAFQHSSFLAGGKVTSAGIIVVKHGLIKSLNPLSGHYRSSIDSFRSFIGQLEAKGVDLSHVKIAKSVLSLWGLSKYSKVTKAQNNLITHVQRTLHLSHEPTEEEKSQALQENAEREEREHQERMKIVRKAEEEAKRSGEIKDDSDDVATEKDKEEMRELRREVLYGHRRLGEEKKKL